MAKQTSTSVIANRGRTPALGGPTSCNARYPAAKAGTATQPTWSGLWPGEKPENPADKSGTMDRAVKECYK